MTPIDTDLVQVAQVVVVQAMAIPFMFMTTNAPGSNPPAGGGPSLNFSVGTNSMYILMVL